jgi:Fe-S-cluster containining protein
MNEKEETKEFRFECVRCGKCCTDNNTLVNVTYQDILRIKNGLNLTLEETIEILGFYVFDETPTEEDRKKMVISPIKTEKGLAFTGLKKNFESCYFYDIDNKRCKIYKIRPIFCRTFPFSFKIFQDEKDKTKAKIKIFYTEKGKQYCPGIEENAPLIDLDEWIKVGKKTIEEMNTNYLIMQKWNEGVEQEKVTPTVRNFLLTIFNLDEKSEVDNK